MFNYQIDWGGAKAILAVAWSIMFNTGVFLFQWSITDIMIAIIVPGLIDVLTGIWVARLQSDGKTSKWFKGVNRLCMYLVIGLCVNSIAKISPQQLAFANILASLISMGETVSVVENLKKVCYIKDMQIGWLDKLSHMLRLNEDDLMKDALKHKQSDNKEG